MVADLDLDVEIVGVPTVREYDGLGPVQPQPLPRLRRSGAARWRCRARWRPALQPGDRGAAAVEADGAGAVLAAEPGRRPGLPRPDRPAAAARPRRTARRGCSSPDG
ncbi:MAG: hypothetical protein WKF47_03800 [Geodermatophilaceae bacterium]